MGGPLVPLVVIVLMISLLATYQNNTKLVTPQPYTLQMNNDATTFLAYRNSVTSYLQVNPSFTGSVPAASLPAQFSTAFLAGAGNFVTATGTGTVITCWAKVANGAAQQAMTLAGVDPSIGTSNGSTWVTAAPAAVVAPVVLTTTVPAGDIVSVIQIGE